MEEILKDQYLIKKVLGSGQFGIVFLAEDIVNKRQVAIKRVSLSKLKDEYLKKTYQKELNIMKLCECENSVRLIENFTTENDHNLVLDLCDCDLDDELKKRKRPFTEDEVKQILIQLSNVFMIMDRENIIHRDLKLKNILIKYDSNQENSLGFIVKLADFGFSKVMEEDITSSTLGTPATMAPEVLSGQNYSKKADLWSLGIITYHLLFNCLPFRERRENLLRVILNTKEIKFPETNKISSGLKSLLNGLIQVDPNLRLSWKEFFNHPYLNLNASKNSEIINLQDSIPYAQFEDKYYGTRKLSGDSLSDFSIVRAKNKETNEFVMIKEIKKEILDSNELYKKIFLKEIHLLKTLQGDCFVKLIEVFCNDSSIFIVTEYFEGKILDLFVKSRESLSEAFVQKLLRALVPGIKELMERKIVLEFLSPQSFCFKSFESEDNFKIKFFDYGLNSLFTDPYMKCSYLLNEGIPGELSHQKTNVLSLGLTVFKILFGENIYKFSSKETIEESILNLRKKTIKITKYVSKPCKYFIEKTCHLNIDRRYDWKALLEDSFIKIQYNEDILLNLSPKQSLSNALKIDDKKIDIVIDYLHIKTDFIIKYFTAFLNKENKIESFKFHSFYKEMAVFILLTINELTLVKALFNKNSLNEDMEISIVKLSKKEFEHSYCNFLRENVSLNFENPAIESYLKILTENESALDGLLRLVIDQLEIDLEHLKGCKKLTELTGSDFGYLEKYCFKVMEYGISNYQKKEYKVASDDFLLSRYMYEMIIMFNIFNRSKTKSFFEMMELLDTLHPKLDVKENEDFIVVSLLGGLLKDMKRNNVLVPSDSAIAVLKSNSYSDSDKERDFISIMLFYPEIQKMYSECVAKL